MIRVMLVDDEPFILEGLSVVIDWEKEGFEIVHKAANAKDAIAFLRKNEVQLIISDIKMPDMTGLEFLEYIRNELNTDSYFVILSGFNDFKFVRNAMQFDCLDYMLKPIDKIELTKILGKVKDLYAEKISRQKNKSLVEKEFFSRNILPMIYGKYDSANLDNVKKYIGDCPQCRYVSIELNLSSSKIKNLSEEDKLSVLRSLYERCLSMFSDFPYRVIHNVSVRNGTYDVGIIFDEEILKSGLFSCADEKDFFEHLKEKIRNEFEYPVFVFAGNKVESIEKINLSVSSILMARYIANMDSISQEKNVESKEALLEANKADKICADALISAVELNNEADIKKYTRELFISLKKKDNHNLTMIINYIIYEIIHLADEQDHDVNQQEILMNIGKNAYEEIFLEESSRNVEIFLLDYASYLAQLRGNQAKGLMVNIENDMRNSYKENLTLKEFSKKYYINAAYLGQIFRKQFGESFKDHLNRIRAEKACELLIKTDMRVYEIAEEVGYKDLDYFIEKFISFYNCTPAKFRKQAVAN